MSNRFFIYACVASALLAASPAALAQDNSATTSADAANMSTDSMATNTADPLATNGMTADPTATGALPTDPLASDSSMNSPTDDQDHDDFPWGLLGLLGLAGLLGLKRRDHNDVHVDRTNTGRDSSRM